MVGYTVDKLFSEITLILSKAATPVQTDTSPNKARLRQLEQRNGVGYFNSVPLGTPANEKPETRFPVVIITLIGIFKQLYK